MALIHCFDCGEMMATSARQCLRCGSVNRGLHRRGWTAPDDDPPQLERQGVTVARRHCTVDGAVYPLLLVNRVQITSRDDPAAPNHDASSFLAVAAIALSLGALVWCVGSVYFLGLGTTDLYWLFGSILTLAGAAGWIRYTMRPVREIHRVHMNDEVGGEVQLLPWTYSVDDAGLVAIAVAAGAGLDSVTLDAQRKPRMELRLNEGRQSAAPRKPARARDPVLVAVAWVFRSMAGLVVLAMIAETVAGFMMDGFGAIPNLRGEILQGAVVATMVWVISRWFFGKAAG